MITYIDFIEISDILQRPLQPWRPSSEDSVALLRGSQTLGLTLKALLHSRIAYNNLPNMLPANERHTWASGI